MSAIVNARDVLLQAAATRLDAVSLPVNVAVPWPNVTGATKPSDYADVTTSILTASGTSIVMNNANLFKSGSGAGGVFIGSGGLFGKDSGGTETFAIDASTGATRFAGSITGGADINITGNARFRGAYTGGVTNASVYANESNTAKDGVFGQSSATLASHGATGIGVRGYGSGAEAFGVAGVSDSAVGVSGVSGSSTAAGVRGANTGGGPALECVTIFKWGSYLLTPPAGGSNVLRSDGSWGAAGSAAYATTAGSASSATYAGTSGEVNNPGNAALRAVSGAYSLIVQTDRNVVLYDGASSIWSTGTAVSDFRLKTAITPTAVIGLDAIGALRVVDFEWKPDTPFADGGAIHTGFIAQEVQKVISDATNQVGDTLHLHKEEIVPLLVKAIQELLARVEAIEATP